MEDYAANRKGPQAGGGLFGTAQPTPQASTSFSFNTQNKPGGFGSTVGGEWWSFSYPVDVDSSHSGGLLLFLFVFPVGVDESHPIW